MALILSIPILILYLQIGPRGYKRAIQFFAFLISLGGAILFYVRHPNSLPSVADKVGYFSGATLSVPGVLEFALKD